MPDLNNTIQTEINTDPLQRGYATLVTAQNWQGLANLLNTGTGGTLQTPTMDRSAFQIAILPAVVALKANLSLQSWYGMVLTIINSANAIDLTNLAIQGLIQEAVSDGLLTSQQASAIGQFPATRLQVLMGSLSVFVSAAQVQAALAS